MKHETYTQVSYTQNHQPHCEVGEKKRYSENVSKTFQFVDSQLTTKEIVFVRKIIIIVKQENTSIKMKNEKLWFGENFAEPV
jgi:hypothetical protein